MKNIVTSVSAIENVLNDECVYVDKTAYMHKLITSADKQFFISRPRRFGKSLMLSTLKAIFEGRKELFQGLAISKTDYDWPVYPVLHLDMTCVRATSIEEIRAGLNAIVLKLAKQLNFKIQRSSDPGMSFEYFWSKVAEKNLKVVVLVDEYDIPLQGFLNKPAELDELRLVMHDFYVRLKSYGSNIRFLMMTGVTKLTKLSVFSGLNNPIDLSMDPDYAGMFGYTQDELDVYFSEHIAAFADKEGCSYQEIKNQLLANYDHYRFAAENEVCVLNPISVGTSLKLCSFGSYWNSTGAASLVLEALRKAKQWPSDLDDVMVLTASLDVCNPIEMPVIPLLYQSGFLTIKQGHTKREREEIGGLPRNMLKLGIPNEEVRQSLAIGHISSFLGENVGARFGAKSGLAIYALECEKPNDAIQLFRSSIASLPYEWLINDEGGAKIAFLDFFQMMRGTTVICERETAGGRIDAVVDTDKTTYIFEFKYNKSSQEAFDQIIEKKYHEPYLGKGKRVYGIGLNFNPDSGSRGIDEPVVEVIG